MTEILIGTNLITLALLGMALRANWLWRQASRKTRHSAAEELRTKPYRSQD